MFESMTTAPSSSIFDMAFVMFIFAVVLGLMSTPVIFAKTMAAIAGYALVLTYRVLVYVIARTLWVFVKFARLILPKRKSPTTARSVHVVNPNSQELLPPQRKLEYRRD
ncbi:hypothetical protein TK90_2868 (plasmid) [Thioalkalivibrio sp. K90mix]|uniref:hypothetical protein n=1 Tax=Thioalkalivibrio sp. (strain K90mix) TaxID=396595 RepID=UPI000195A944|nr:hypothetical protein [Thioalkalivibrio sp. K90mix]ADC73352.1 hypothetical protein TK90_2868 [Thioalkalivibrio sp. K90mix]